MDTLMSLNPFFLWMFSVVCFFISHLLQDDDDPSNINIWQKTRLWFRGPPSDNPGGLHVAEAYIDWETCSGSTLYRARFESAEAAEHAARGAAWLLDQMLPTGFPAKDAAGRIYSEPYNFEIRFNVREVTPLELKPKHFRPVWSPALPGTKRFSGEHASLRNT